MHQCDIDVEVFLQFFNTPGTEVTPRSDVVGEYLEFDGLGHEQVLVTSHTSHYFLLLLVTSHQVSSLLMKRLAA
jgi:hypothetical protein